MLTDITLGQYFPVKSPIHSLDPRFKIIATFIYIIAVFMADSILSYIVTALFTLGMIFLSRVKLKLILKGLKPLIFIIIFTAVINIFMTTSDDVIFKAGIFKITLTGVKNAVLMALRLIFLVMGTSLLTFTTSPIMLTDGIEKLLTPFAKIGLPAHELAMMMTIALRFIPTLLEETDKIIKAQKARGADFESGNILNRAKALVPILVPLFISSFRRADELATAMECRCYRGGEGRTRLRELKINCGDWICLAVMVLFTAAVVLSSKVL